MQGSNTQSSILYLYRCILRKAKEYPSIRRDVIVEEIRYGGVMVLSMTMSSLILLAEFRKNRHLTEENDIREAVNQAVEGYSALAKYSSAKEPGPFQVLIE